MQNKYGIAIAILILTLLTSCSESRSDEMTLDESTNIEDVESTDSDTKVKYEEIEIYGGITLKLARERFYDDVYGTGQIDNMWSLEEINTIMNAIKGQWSIKNYEGFVAAPIFIPDLFDAETLSEDERDRLLEMYNIAVESSKSLIPDIVFSIKEFDSTDVDMNYIGVNNSFLSPVSIILSLDKTSENYPVFVDRTAITTDISIKYPVIYLKFFTKTVDEGGKEIYQPATLIMSSDDNLYVLINGAYYSCIKE